MTTISDGARHLAEAINDGGQASAYTDPGKAAANRPCVLIAPPSLDWTEGTFVAPGVTWRLICLTRHDTATLAALDELADLIDACTDALPAIDRAEPSSYALTATARVPAYVLTLTTT